MTKLFTLVGGALGGIIAGYLADAAGIPFLWGFVISGVGSVAGIVAAGNSRNGSDDSPHTRSASSTSQRVPTTRKRTFMPASVTLRKRVLGSS